MHNLDQECSWNSCVNFKKRDKYLIHKASNVFEICYQLIQLTIGFIKQYHLQAIEFLDDPKLGHLCLLNINEKVEHSKVNINILKGTMTDNLELYIKEPSKSISPINACLDNIIISISSTPTIQDQCIIKKENLHLSTRIINTMD